MVPMISDLLSIWQDIPWWAYAGIITVAVILIRWGKWGCPL